MRTFLAGLASVLIAGEASGQQVPAAYLRPAHFRVTDRPLTGPIPAFAATVHAIGNSLIGEGGAFEPLIYRNKFIALEDAPDRIVVAPEALSRSHTWPAFSADSLREGFFDDADVRVYRIERGKFRLVRKDSVPPGGSRMSGWVPLQSGRQLVSPRSSSYLFQGDGAHRPGARCYFTVRSVDRKGRVSSAASPVVVVWPGGRAVQQPSPNALVDTRAESTLSEVASLAAPLGLRATLSASNTVLLEWEKSDNPEISGFAVYRSDYPPAEHRGYFLRLKQSSAGENRKIKAGDMVVVNKKFHSTSRTRLLSSRAWGSPSEFRQLLPGLVGFFPDEDSERFWELVAHEPGTAVTEGGETYLKLELASGAKEALAVAYDSDAGQSRYDVTDRQPYRMEVWLRREGAGRVRFTVSGPQDNEGHPNAPVEFSPGRTWRKFEANFSPGPVQPGGRPPRMAVEFTGPGTFHVDNFRMYRADAGHMDILPEDLRAIRTSAMVRLRTHDFIKTRTRTYDLAQFTNPAGVIDATARGMTLPQMLGVFQKAAVQPWLQIEFHLAPEEWLGLVEYLAAPISPGRDSAQSRPWAYKRFMQGRQAPWADAFESIHVELGNETWNRLFAPWIFTPMRDAETGRAYSAGEAYGLFQEYVISIWKSSPYWTRSGLDKKVAFVLGGQNAGELQFARGAARTSPSSAYATIGAYLGEWDAAEGPPRLTGRTLFDLLNQVSQAAIPSADQLRSVAREIALTQRRGFRPGIYEGGPGYALNGLNGAKVSAAQAEEQERVMKSLAAGTATLDGFLARASRGFELQSFFAYGAGPYWTSHAPWFRGGGAHPSWQLLSLFNHQAVGEMLGVETLSVPSMSLAGSGRRKAIADAPLAAVYATRRGARYSLFVISRKVPGYPYDGDAGFTRVTVDLPFEHAESLTLYRLAGAPEASALRGDAIEVRRIEMAPEVVRRRFPIDGSTGADVRGMPAAATYLYVFEGAGNRPPR